MPPAILPFGVAAIDEALPGGGLALGALHEVSGAAGDEEDGAVGAGFLAGILARLSQLPPGSAKPILWCLARDDLYAPGFAPHGLDASRILHLRAHDDRSVLAAMEEGLRVNSLAAVVGEVGALPLTASRRLQLAAAKSGVTAFVLRRWRNGTRAAAERNAPCAAATRWRVRALSGEVGTGSPLDNATNRDSRALSSVAQDGEPGIGRPRWLLELLRCRGGLPAQWIVEASDATGHVSLSAQLVDRPAAPQYATG